jgi:hypothetical protein
MSATLGTSGSSASPSGFNIGSDTVISFLVGGAVQAWQIGTSFEERQVTEKVTSSAITGTTRVRDVEMSWEGTFEYDRSDSVIEDFFAAKEVARYSGGIVPDVQIATTTTNVDQSISRYQHVGVTMTLETTGPKTGAAVQKGRVSYRSSRRLKIA